MKKIILTLILIVNTLIAQNSFVDNELKTEKVHVHTQNKSKDNNINSNDSRKNYKNIDQRVKHQNGSCQSCLPNSMWYEE